MDNIFAPDVIEKIFNTSALDRKPTSNEFESGEEDYSQDFETVVVKSSLPDVLINNNYQQNLSNSAAGVSGSHKEEGISGLSIADLRNNPEFKSNFPEERDLKFGLVLQKIFNKRKPRY